MKGNGDLPTGWKSSVVAFHGLVMNGGLEHAIHLTSAAELEAVQRGFSAIGLNPVAVAIREAVGQAHATSPAAQNEDWYASVVPDDGELEKRLDQAVPDPSESVHVVLPTSGADLGARYRALIVQRAEEASNARLANRTFGKIYAEMKVLRESAEGRAAIDRLVSDEDPKVRLQASVHASAWNPGLALPVLEGLEQDRLGMTGFEAHYVLLAYRNGTLHYE